MPEAKVREEYQAFLKQLPDLLKTLSGKWVVFKDGHVQKDFSDENEAFSFAVEKFGLAGGFVIAPVKPVEPTPITAGMLYSAP